jgi:hypothetical protein
VTPPPGAAAGVGRPPACTSRVPADSDGFRLGPGLSQTQARTRTRSHRARPGRGRWRPPSQHGPRRVALGCGKWPGPGPGTGAGGRPARAAAAGAASVRLSGLGSGLGHGPGSESAPGPGLRGPLGALSPGPEDRDRRSLRPVARLGVPGPPGPGTVLAGARAGAVTVT